MKCIKTIKKTSSREIGEVVRTEEKDADLKVSTGVWVYCPKSEWKSLTRRVKPIVKKETEEGSEDKPITKRGKNSIQ
jgi:phage pi2 protein 07